MLMRYELEQYVKTVCTPHQYTAFVQAFDFFDKIELSEYLDHAENIMLAQTAGMEKPDDLLVPQLYNYVGSCVIAFLRNCGVIIREDASENATHLSLLVKFAEGFTTIPDYEDKQHIQDMIGSAEDDHEEALAVVVADLTGELPEHYLPILEDVSPACIETILRLTKPPIEVADLPENFERCVKDVSRVIKAAGYHGLYAESFLMGSSTVGMDFEIYFKRYAQDRMADFKGKPVQTSLGTPTGQVIVDYKRVAFEFLALAALSKQGLASHMQLLATHGSTLFPDPLQLREFNREVTEEFPKVAS